MQFARSECKGEVPVGVLRPCVKEKCVKRLWSFHGTHGCGAQSGRIRGGRVSYSIRIARVSLVHHGATPPIYIYTGFLQLLPSIALLGVEEPILPRREILVAG